MNNFKDMGLIDSLEKIDNYLSETVLVNEGQIKLEKKYYLVIDEFDLVECNENDADFSCYNHQEFLFQVDCNKIIDEYETTLDFNLQKYGQELTETFSLCFRNLNTDLDKRMYCENIISQLSTTVFHFKKYLNTGKDDFNGEINVLQKMLLRELISLYSGFKKEIESDFGKYLNSNIEVENLRTIFGLRLDFVEKFYQELVSYSYIDTEVDLEFFNQVVKLNYSNDKKIVFSVNTLPEIYALINFIREKSPYPKMKFYALFADRFEVNNTTGKSNILTAKRISNGISSINKNETSRVVKRGSEIYNLINSIQNL